MTEVDPAQLSAVPDKVRKVPDGARCFDADAQFARSALGISSTAARSPT